jgi:hypothetical protein
MALFGGCPGFLGNWPFEAAQQAKPDAGEFSGGVLPKALGWFWERNVRGIAGKGR